jgi:hypothetical protein
MLEDMVEIPAENLSPKWGADARTPLPRVGDERETLTGFLDWHRETFALKCAGLADEQLSVAGVPPSTMTLHGLARHLAGVERWWFRIQFAGEDVPLLHYTDDDPDQDFDSLDGDPQAALALWRQECSQARAIVSATASLDELGKQPNGEPFTLRYVLTSMVAEYARHDGHADLLRETIDGATGY